MLVLQKPHVTVPYWNKTATQSFKTEDIFVASPLESDRIDHKLLSIYM